MILDFRFSIPDLMAIEAGFSPSTKSEIENLKSTIGEAHA